MKTIILLLSGLYSFFLFGQIEPVLYDVIDMEKYGDIHNYIPMDNGGLLYYEQPYTKGFLNLVLFDDKGVVLSVGTITPENNRDNYFSLHHFNQSVYVSYEYMDKELASYKLVMQKVDLNNFILGDEEVVATMPQEVYKANKKLQGKVGYLSGFRTRIYEDSIVVKVDDFVNQKFEVKVIDTKFNVLHSGSIDLSSYGFQFSEIHAVKLNSSGEFEYSIMLYNWKERTDENDYNRVDKSYLTIFGTVDNPENIARPLIDLSSLKDVPEKMYTRNISKGVSAVGYFTYDEKTYTECFHQFYWIRNEGETYGEAIHCFDPEFLWSYASEPWKSIHKKSLKPGKTPRKLNMIFTNVIQNADATMTYFLDQNYQMKTTNDNGSIYSNLIYHFGSVLALNYSEDGSLNWKVVIPKYQIASGRSRMLGVRLKVLTDGTTILLFNNLDNDNKMYNLKMVSISDEGEVEQLMDYTFHKKIEGLVARDFKFINDAFYIRFIEGKKSRVMKINPNP